MLARWSGWGAVPGIFDTDRADLAAERGELASLLNEQELAAAARNTLNAHYTDAGIVQAIWAAIGDLGFSSGSVLEPGCGSGNFIAFAPGGAQITGVELDPVTAAIAAALYPQAQIRPESFADSRIPEDYFDLTVGNVPFAPGREVRLVDKVHNPGRRHSLHNHFILKSLHLTRPGGLVVVLTSRYTMDAENPAVRREISELADLVGAVRLPNRAQQRAAGTTVMMDLLILRRRDGEPPSDPPAWEQTRRVELDGNEVPVNSYFLDHPDMVLGEMRAVHGAYRGGDLTVQGSGDPAGALRAALTALTRQAAADGLVWTPAEQDPAAAAGRPRSPLSPLAAAGETSQPDGYLRAHADGAFTQLSDGAEEPFTVPAGQAAELRRLLKIRDSVLALLEAEASTADDTPGLSDLRTDLNRQYDTYVRLHGPINRFKLRPTGRTDPETGEAKQARIRPPLGGFRQDPFAPVVLALEHFDPVSQRAGKAEIFTSRVVAPRSPRLGADNPKDALAICLDLFGEVRVEVIARLLGQTPEETRASLGGLVYEIPPGPPDDAAFLAEHAAADLSALTGFNLTGADLTGSPGASGSAEAGPPPGTLVPAAEYLSGRVRDKLRIAEQAAAGDPRFQANVDALREVMPADVQPGEITAQLGAAWVNTAHVQQFLRELLDDDTVLVEHPGGPIWVVKGPRDGVLATSTWGTSRYSATDLAEAILAQRPIQVRDTIKVTLPNGSSSERRVLNPDETLAAQEKATEIKEQFAEWAWKDPDRAADLATSYNELFNSLVLRNYDDADLSLQGLVLGWDPHPHQVAAVARILAEPSVGLFHEVGAGKTAEMVMGAMELRRLGLARKPAICVPNHMLEQFSREFLQLYPQARILVAQKEDLVADKRRLFVARCATGDWDAVIIGHSAFEKIPMSREAQQAYMTQELARISEWIENAKAESGLSVKRLEGMKLAAEERLKRKLDATRDPGITFEATGIDYLFVDEGHLFKNLRTLSSIPGAAIDGSMRASDLDMKLHYLRKKNGNRVTTLATATPIANSITEAHVMMRYLRPDLLEKAGVIDFDVWGGTFGQLISEIELAPEGGTSFRMNTRFARFINVPEMLRMFHVPGDVKTAEDLNLPVPRIAARADGKRVPETVAVDPTEGQQAAVEELGHRADRLRRRLVTPDEDNMLSICTDGRKAGLDLRLLGLAMDGPGKIGVAAGRIAGIYHQNRDNVYTGPDGQPHPIRGALQIVFSDLGTPNPHRWNVYDELRAQLVALGVPRAGIRFIHEAKNDQQKGELFADARAGKIAVLIGSTAMMGVGTNVQARAIALHHLDCPWRPADVAQREGRILRQGNQNDEIQIIRYVTERTFDAYMWQTLARKARFIAQVMRGRLDVREIEDIGDAALSFDEVKALATANPLLIDKAKADTELTRLERAQRAHQRNQDYLQHTITRSTQRAGDLTNLVPQIDQAIGLRRETRGDAFTMRVDSRAYTKRTEAGQALKAALLREASGLERGQSRTVQAGTFGGFTIAADVRAWASSIEIVVHLEGAPGTDLRLDRAELQSHSASGLVTKIENKLHGLQDVKAATLKEIDRLHAETERATAEVGKPFTQADDLTAARAEAKRIDEELRAMADESERERDQRPDPSDTAAAPEPGPPGRATDATSPSPAPAPAASSPPRQPSHREQANHDSGTAGPQTQPGPGTAAASPRNTRDTGAGAAGPAATPGPPLIGSGSWPADHPFAADIDALLQAALADPDLALMARANDPSHFMLGFCDWPPGAIVDNFDLNGGQPSGFENAFFSDLSLAAGVTAAVGQQVYLAHADPARREYAATTSDFTAEAAQHVFREWETRITGARTAQCGCGHDRGCPRCELPRGHHRALHDVIAADMGLARAGIALTQPENAAPRPDLPYTRTLTWDDDAGAYVIDITGDDSGRFRLIVPEPPADWRVQAGDAPSISFPGSGTRPETRPAAVRYVLGLLPDTAGMDEAPSGPPSSARERDGLSTDGLRELAGRHGLIAGPDVHGVWFIRQGTDPGTRWALQQEQPGQPLMDRTGRIIPDGRAGAYLTAWTAAPDTDLDQLYAQVFPDTGRPPADEHAFPRNVAHSACSDASCRAQDTGCDHYLYTDGRAAVAAARPPATAAYYAVTPDGRWTRHMDGTTEVLERPPNHSGLSVIAGETAAARPAVSQPPAPADWTVSHPYADQISAMRAAALASPLIVNACGNDNGNFSIAFADWAHHYYAGTTRARLAAGGDLPDWVRAFIDDTALTADLTATLGRQVRQQLIGGPAASVEGLDEQAVTTAAQGWQQRAEQARGSAHGCRPTCGQCQLPSNPALLQATTIDMYLARAGISHTDRAVTWDDGTATWTAGITDGTSWWRLATHPGYDPTRVTRDAAYAGQLPPGQPGETADRFRILVAAQSRQAAARAAAENSQDAGSHLTAAVLRDLAAEQGLLTAPGDTDDALDVIPAVSLSGGLLVNANGRTIPGARAGAYLAAYAAAPRTDPDLLYAQVVAGQLAGAGGAIELDEWAFPHNRFHHARDDASSHTEETGRTWYVFSDGRAYVSAAHAPADGAAYCSVTAGGQWTCHIDGRAEPLPGLPSAHDFSALTGGLAGLPPAEPAAAGSTAGGQPPRPVSATAIPGADKRMASYQEMASRHGLIAEPGEADGEIVIRSPQASPGRFVLIHQQPGDPILNAAGRIIRLPRAGAYLAAYVANRNAGPDQLYAQAAAADPAAAADEHAYPVQDHGQAHVDVSSRAFRTGTTHYVYRDGMALVCTPHEPAAAPYYTVTADSNWSGSPGLPVPEWGTPDLQNLTSLSTGPGGPASQPPRTPAEPPAPADAAAASPGAPPAPGDGVPPDTGPPSQVPAADAGPVIGRVTVLYGHVSPETAYVIEDYPYGRSLRCHKRVWIEGPAAKGSHKGQYRLVEQTDNPKAAGQPWNNPKKGTYTDWMVLYRDEFTGHIRHHAASLTDGLSGAYDARMRLDGTYGQLTADDRKVYDKLVRAGQRADRWDSWFRAREFIRAHHAEHGTWPTEEQVSQAPGFYLNDTAVAVADVAHDLRLASYASTPAATGQDPAPPVASETPAASPQGTAGHAPDPEPASPREAARRVAEAVTSAGRSPAAAGIQVTETPGEPPMTYDLRLPAPVAQLLELGSGAYGHAEHLIALALGVSAVTVLRASSDPDGATVTLAVRGTSAEPAAKPASQPPADQPDAADRAGTPAHGPAAADAPGQDPVAYDGLNEVTVNQADWTAPDGISPGWLIANAPRPLNGEITWEGDFLHGRFYAAAPASDTMLASWRAADAWLVRFTTNDQIAADVDRYLASEGYGSAEAAGVTIEDIASDLGLPWSRTAARKTPDPDPDAAASETARAAGTGPDQAASTARPGTAGADGQTYTSTSEAAADVAWTREAYQTVLDTDAGRQMIGGLQLDVPAAAVSAAQAAWQALPDSDLTGAPQELAAACTAWADATATLAQISPDRYGDQFRALADEAADRARHLASRMTATALAGGFPGVQLPGPAAPAGPDPETASPPTADSQPAAGQRYERTWIRSESPAAMEYAANRAAETGHSYYLWMVSEGYACGGAEPPVATFTEVTPDWRWFLHRDGNVSPVTLPPELRKLSGRGWTEPGDGTTASPDAAPASRTGTPAEPGSAPAPGGEPPAETPAAPAGTPDQPGSAAGADDHAVGQAAPADSSDIPEVGAMRFMNNMDIEEAAERWRNHPVLGPATRTLASLREWTDRHSDGWAYWGPPVRAAARLMELIERDGTWRYVSDRERPDATEAELRRAYTPIRAFRTKHQADFPIVEPGQAGTAMPAPSVEATAADVTAASDGMLPVTGREADAAAGQDEAGSQQEPDEELSAEDAAFAYRHAADWANGYDNDRALDYAAWFRDTHISRATSIEDLPAHPYAFGHYRDYLATLPDGQDYRAATGAPDGPARPAGSADRPGPGGAADPRPAEPAGPPPGPSAAGAAQQASGPAGPAPTREAAGAAPEGTRAADPNAGQTGHRAMPTADADRVYQEAIDWAVAVPGRRARGFANWYRTTFLDQASGPADLPPYPRAWTEFLAHVAATEPASGTVPGRPPGADDPGDLAAPAVTGADPDAEQPPERLPEWVLAHPFADDIVRLRNTAVNSTDLGQVARGSRWDNFARPFSVWVDERVLDSLGADGGGPPFAVAMWNDLSFSADVEATIGRSVYAMLGQGQHPVPSGDSIDAAAVTGAARRRRQHIQEKETRACGCRAAAGCQNCRLPADHDAALKQAAEVDLHLARAGVPHQIRSITWLPDYGSYAVNIAGRAGPGSAPEARWLVLMPGHNDTGYPVTLLMQDLAKRITLLTEGDGPAGVAAQFRDLVAQRTNRSLVMPPPDRTASPGQSPAAGPSGAASPAGAQPAPAGPAASPPGITTAGGDGPGQPGAGAAADPAPAGGEPGDPAAAGGTAPAGPADLVIKHGQAGTVILGSTKEDRELHEILHRIGGFKPSRRGGGFFWYLPRTWQYDTRSRRVRQLTDALVRAGRVVPVIDNPHEAPAGTFEPAPLPDADPYPDLGALRIAVQDLARRNFALRGTAGGKRILGHDGRLAGAAFTAAAVTYTDSWPDMKRDLTALAARLTRLAHAAEELQADLRTNRTRAPRFTQELDEFVTAARVAAARTAATAAARPSGTVPAAGSAAADTGTKDTAATPVPADEDAGLFPAGTVATGSTIRQPAGPVADAAEDQQAGDDARDADQASPAGAAAGDTAGPAPAAADTARRYVWRDGDQLIIGPEPPAEGGYLCQDAGGTWAEHWHGTVTTLEHPATGPAPAADYPVTLTEARALGQRYRMDVQITHVADRSYVTLAHPDVPAVPVFSFAAGDREVFAGGHLMPPSEGIAYLAAYRAAVDELATATVVFTFTSGVRDWTWRVAQMATQLAGPGSDPEIRSHLMQAAHLAWAGDGDQADRELTAAEQAGTSFTLAPVRAAHIIEVIDDEAARYASLSPARYVADLERVDSHGQERGWIARYITDHPDVLKRAPLNPEARRARDNSRQQARQARGNEAASAAHSACTAGDLRQALFLADDGELASPDDVRWPQIQAEIRRGVPPKPRGYQLACTPPPGPAAGAGHPAHSAEVHRFPTQTGLEEALRERGFPAAGRDGIYQLGGARWQWGLTGTVLLTARSQPVVIYRTGPNIQDVLAGGAPRGYLRWSGDVLRYVAADGTRVATLYRSDGKIIGGQAIYTYRAYLAGNGTEVARRATLEDAVGAVIAAVTLTDAGATEHLTRSHAAEFTGRTLEQARALLGDRDFEMTSAGPGESTVSIDGSPAGRVSWRAATAELTGPDGTVFATREGRIGPYEIEALFRAHQYEQQSAPDHTNAAQPTTSQAPAPDDAAAPAAGAAPQPPASAETGTGTAPAAGQASTIAAEHGQRDGIPAASTSSPAGTEPGENTADRDADHPQAGQPSASAPADDRHEPATTGPDPQVAGTSPGSAADRDGQTALFGAPEGSAPSAPFPPAPPDPAGRPEPSRRRRGGGGGSSMTPEDYRLRTWTRRRDQVHAAISTLAASPVPDAVTDEPSLAAGEDTWLVLFLADLPVLSWDDDLAVTAWDILRRDSEQHSRDFTFSSLPAPPGPDAEPSPDHVTTARERALATMTSRWPELLDDRHGIPFVRCSNQGAPVIAGYQLAADGGTAARMISGGREHPTISGLFVFPFTSLPQVVALARQQGTEITAGMEVLAGTAAAQWASDHGHTTAAAEAAGIQEEPAAAPSGPGTTGSGHPRELAPPAGSKPAGVADAETADGDSNAQEPAGTGTASGPAGEPVSGPPAGAAPPPVTGTTPPDPDTGQPSAAPITGEDLAVALQNIPPGNLARFIEHGTTPSARWTDAGRLVSEPDTGATEQIDTGRQGLSIRISAPGGDRAGQVRWTRVAAWLQPGLSPGRRELLTAAHRAFDQYSALTVTHTVPGTPAHTMLQGACRELDMMMRDAAGRIISAALASHGPGPLAIRPAASGQRPAETGAPLIPPPGHEDGDDEVIGAYLDRIGQLSSVLPASPNWAERQLSQIQPGDVIIRHPAIGFSPAEVMARPRVTGDTAELDVLDGRDRKVIRLFTGTEGLEHRVSALPGGFPLTGPIPPAAAQAAASPAGPGPGVPASERLVSAAPAPPAEEDSADHHTDVPATAGTQPGQSPATAPAAAAPSDSEVTDGQDADSVLRHEAAAVHSWNEAAFARAGLTYPPRPGEVPVTEEPPDESAFQPGPAAIETGPGPDHSPTIDAGGTAGADDSPGPAGPDTPEGLPTMSEQRDDPATPDPGDQPAPAAGPSQPADAAAGPDAALPDGRDRPAPAAGPGPAGPAPAGGPPEAERPGAATESTGAGGDERPGYLRPVPPLNEQPGPAHSEIDRLIDDAIRRYEAGQPPADANESVIYQALLEADSRGTGLTAGWRQQVVRDLTQPARPDRYDLRYTVREPGDPVVRAFSRGSAIATGCRMSSGGRDVEAFEVGQDGERLFAAFRHGQLAAPPSFGQAAGDRPGQPDPWPGPAPEIPPTAVPAAADVAGPRASVDHGPLTVASAPLAGGVCPLPVTATAGGRLRSSRLLYADGTAVEVRPGGHAGPVWTGMTAGVVPGTQDSAGAWQQVIRLDRDGDLTVAHPAQVSPRGVDPYAWLTYRQQQRFAAFDGMEAAGADAAPLAAQFIDSGDVIRVEHPAGSWTHEVRDVVHVSHSPGGVVTITTVGPGGSIRPESVPATEMITTIIPAVHPAEGVPGAQHRFALPGGPGRGPATAAAFRDAAPFPDAVAARAARASGPPPSAGPGQARIGGDRIGALERRLEQLAEEVRALREAGQQPPPAAGTLPPGAGRAGRAGVPGGVPESWQPSLSMAEALRGGQVAVEQHVPQIGEDPVWRQLRQLTRAARDVAAGAFRGRLHFTVPDRAVQAWREIWARLCEVTGDFAAGLMGRLRSGGRGWQAARALRHAAAEGTAQARGWLARGERLPLGSYEPPPGMRARTRVAADAGTQLHDLGAGVLRAIDFPGPLQGALRRGPAGRRARADAALTARHRAARTAGAPRPVPRL